jgi:hypothetical protein
MVKAFNTRLVHRRGAEGAESEYFFKNLSPTPTLCVDVPDFTHLGEFGKFSPQRHRVRRVRREIFHLRGAEGAEFGKKIRRIFTAEAQRAQSSEDF